MKTYKSTIPRITLAFCTNEAIPKAKLTTSLDVFKYCDYFLDKNIIELYEEFFVVFVNRCNNSIGWRKFSRGSSGGTVLDLAHVVYTAVECNAAAVVLVHNHPSGNIQPSSQDIQLTTKITSALKLMDIAVLDHVIITKNRYFSFSDEGVLPSRQ